MEPSRDFMLLEQAAARVYCPFGRDISVAEFRVAGRGCDVLQPIARELQTGALSRGNRFAAGFERSREN